jgi:hypothetical protein
VILIHRWMGIALSLLFLMWFLSGIGMIYAREMPSLTPSVRLERMPVIDFSRVRITPVQALSRAGMRRGGGRLSLLMVMGRPAYRVSTGRNNATIFADSGDELAEIGDEESLDIASRFADLPRSSVHQVAVLEEADQWSIGVRRQLPLHKFAVDDSAHTELYVTEVTAEVVLMTTRSSRALAWVAAIPHWMYFRALRLNDALWTRVVLWTSGLGIVSVALGLVLSLTQMRTKYVGWMRWHYVTGVVFGVLTLTWVFSGWLSMDPIEYTERGSTGARIPQALAGTPNLERFPTFDDARWSEALAGHAVKEIELRGVQGEPYYVLRGAGSPPLLMKADTLEIRHEPFSVDSLMQRVAQGNPGVAVAASELLTDYDAYYYDRDREAPLPVLRVKFADEAATWVYIDPRLSQQVARFTRGERVERWLYHGLHSLDFSFWYYNKPLWEAGMIVLLSGGSILSFVGVVIGFKRLRRVAGRAAGFRSS